MSPLDRTAISSDVRSCAGRWITLSCEEESVGFKVVFGLGCRGVSLILREKDHRDLRCDKQRRSL